MTWREIIRRRLARVGYAIEKANSDHWQWGHPDDWSEAEWFYYRKESK